MVEKSFPVIAEATKLFTFPLIINAFKDLPSIDKLLFHNSINTVCSLDSMNFTISVLNGCRHFVPMH